MEEQLSPQTESETFSTGSEISNQPIINVRATDPRKLANLRRNKASKLGKLNRLTLEQDEIQAILDRGFLIIPGDQDSQNSAGSKHKQLDVTERMHYANKKLAKELEIFDLKVELAGLKAELKEKFSRNRQAGKQKLLKKKAALSVDKATNTLKGVMEAESRNGGAGKLTEVHTLILEGKRDVALKSLMSFLKEKVKAPFKKMESDVEFANKVSAELVEFLPRLIPN
jgi:hypothetical protein